MRWNRSSVGEVLEARSHRDAEPPPGEEDLGLCDIHTGIFIGAGIFLLLRFSIRLYDPAVRLPADCQPPDRFCRFRRARVAGVLLHRPHRRRDVCQHTAECADVLPTVSGWIEGKAI